LGMVLDVATNTQQFFYGHDDDIICAAIHPDGVHVATGQLGKHPYVMVWDSTTLELKATLRGHKRGVSTLAFSQSGNTIASVGRDDSQTMILWDWRSEKAIIDGKCGTRDVHHVSFQGNSEDKPIEVGLKHGSLMAKGARNKGELKAKRVCFSRKLKQQTMYVGCPHNGCTLAGTWDGHLYVLKGNQAGKAVKTHEGPVSAVTSREGLVVAGGKDGNVVILDGKSLNQQACYPAGDRVRSVFIADGGAKILVGTQAAQLLEMDVATGQITSILHAHGQMREKGNLYAGELWGCAVNPSRNGQFATVGDDATVRTWDANNREMLSCFSLPEGKGRDGNQQDIPMRGRTISFNGDGSLMAVGTLEGDTLIYDANGDLQTTIKSRTKARSKEVCGAKWSPDDAKICVGAHTGQLSIYDSSDYSFIDALKGHTSAVTHFDWDQDSEYVQSMSNGYELLFWDAGEGYSMIAASNLNDVEWAKWSMTLGWPVQGIWPAFADGTDINAVAVSPEGSVIATADDFGKVNLLKYPCLVKGSTPVKGSGHCSHVTNVAWMGDSRLLTCGGHDLCIFQWRVTRTD